MGGLTFFRLRQNNAANSMDRVNNKLASAH